MLIPRARITWCLGVRWLECSVPTWQQRRSGLCSPILPREDGEGQSFGLPSRIWDYTGEGGQNGLGEKMARLLVFCPTECSHLMCRGGWALVHWFSCCCNGLEQRDRSWEKKDRHGSIFLLHVQMYEHTFIALLPPTHAHLSHLWGAGNTNTIKYKKGFDLLGCSDDTGLDLSADVFRLPVNWLPSLDSQQRSSPPLPMQKITKYVNYEQTGAAILYLTFIPEAAFWQLNTSHTSIKTTHPRQC